MLEGKLIAIVCGADRRYERICARLEQAGALVYVTGGIEGKRPSMSIAPYADALVLPVKGVPDELIFAEGSVDSMELHRLLAPDILIVGAGLEALKGYFRNCLDLNECEEFLADNAAATAEGAMLEALANSRKTLADSRFLIFGCGRIGRALAQRLNALGAEVTVATRDKSKAASLESMGIGTMATEGAVWLMGMYDAAFNTCPARIIPPEALSLCKECILYELASSPYGFDAEEAEKRGARAVMLPALPGRCFPVSAGDYIVKQALRRLESRGRYDT